MNRYFVFLLFIFLIDISLPADEIFLKPPESFWIAYTYPVAEQMEVYIQEFRDGEWGVAIQVTESLSYNLSPALTLMPDGTLWVAWSSSDKEGTSIHARRYKDGLWSKEYIVSSDDEFDDTQPSLDISPEGTPFIVWAGSDGHDDEILFSTFRNGTWAKEVQVNFPNTVPDIDPCICTTNEDIFILWSSFNEGRYRLTAVEKKLNLFTRVKETDINEILPNEIKNIFSLVFQDGFEFYFFSGKSLYKNSLRKADLTSAPPLQKVLLDPGFEDKFRKMETLLMQNLILCYLSEERKNITINLSPLLDDIKKKRAIPDASLVNILTSKDMELLIKKENKQEPLSSIVAFGDGLTRGYGSASGGYPTLLSQFLARIVLNKGETGEMTTTGLQRIKSVLEKERPEKILILEGMNDLNYGRSLKTIAFNLEEMIVQSLSFGASPYLATLVDNQLYPERTRLMNDEIKKVSKKTGFPLTDLTIFLKGKEMSSYYFDPLYPNDKGYEFLAYGFYLSLKK
ncbi:MAG: hypothetical protein JW928_08515 [Candidatus Aureabacteria bacterium]|nr:hypothetical protein [Candidatus Auribacterota bacterium]